MRPSYEITSKILKLTSSISEKIGEIKSAKLIKPPTELRKRNRIKSIQSSLEIEGNTLTVEQITDIINNKRVLAPQKDIMKTEIIEFSRQSIRKINEIDDLVDSYTDDFKDLTDTASDLIKPLKAFKSLYETTRKIKFKRFLKSYAKGLRQSFTSEDLPIKLSEYLNSEKNLNFVYETIESVLNAKSVICSGILGYLASKILTQQVKLEYKELIFINAFKNLNDFELELAINVIENTEDWTKNQTIAHNDRFSANRESYEYTVQRLKGLHVIREIHGSPGNPVSLGQSFWGTYRLTEISKGFIEIIKESGFYNEIK